MRIASAAENHLRAPAVTPQQQQPYPYNIIIIMVIFKCYFSGERIALSMKKNQERCEHRIRKRQQIKSTVHDAN